MLTAALELAGEALKTGAEALETAAQETAVLLEEKMAVLEAAEVLRTGLPELAEAAKGMRIPRLNSVSSILSGLEQMRAESMKNAAKELWIDSYFTPDLEEAALKEEISEILVEKAESAETHRKIWDALRLPEREVKRVEAVQRRRIS